MEAGCINSVVFKDPLKLFPLEDTGRGVQRRLEHVQIMHNGECNTAVLKLPHEFCNGKNLYLVSKISYVGILKMRLEYILTKQYHKYLLCKGTETKKKLQLVQCTITPPPRRQKKTPMLGH